MTKIILDWTMKEYSIWIDDKSFITSAFHKDHETIDAVEIYNYDSSESYIDEIQLFRDTNLTKLTVSPSSISLHKGAWVGNVKITSQITSPSVFFHVKRASLYENQNGNSAVFQLKNGIPATTIISKRSILACSPGYYGQNYYSECAQCPKGMYAPDSSATSCDPCPKGTYSDILGK